ncbi:MAG: FecR domain-containing protein [Bacteroidota bacterium]
MEITKELLERYEQGLCTREEKKAVKAWFETIEDPTPSDKKILDDNVNRNRVWSQLSQAVPQLESEKSGRDTRVLSFPGKMARYAAAAVLVFTVGFFTYEYLSGDAHKSVGQLAYFEDFRAIETQRGEKRTVTLPDGSTIRMNYETEIRVPEKFEGDRREVYLIGHAHFDVVRNPEKPFIIYTEATKTQVLGTSFDINTKGEENTEVIVTSGQVAFSEKDKEDNRVTLTRNDRAILDGDKSIMTDEVDAIALTAWRENKLVFQDKTLAEMIKVIEPWYDVQIEVENKEALNNKFNLSLNNPSLNDLMDELSFLGDFSFSINDKKVLIQ